VNSQVQEISAHVDSLEQSAIDPGEKTAELSSMPTLLFEPFEQCRAGDYPVDIFVSWAFFSAIIFPCNKYFASAF
jgi:hypothetical protein